MNLAELARRLQPYLYPPGSGGGGGGVAPINASYVVMAANAILTNERFLVQGDGLTMTDAGAGLSLIWALATPGTLTVSTTNTSISPHKHAITSSANPGAAASLLATTSAGALALTIATGISGLTLSSSHVNGIGLDVAAVGGVGVSSTVTTGKAGDFIRTGVGASTTPVVKINTNSGSDTQTALLVRNAGSGLPIDVQDGSGSVFSVLPDGFTNGPGRKRVTSNFDKTNTTLADVPGLSVTLRAGRSYIFRAVLFVDNGDAIGGYKFAMSGTCTATAVIYRITSNVNGNSGFQISSRQTALGGSAGVSSGTGALCWIDGLITVNAGGTLTVHFAQFTASGTSSVLVGSFMTVEDIT